MNQKNNPSVSIEENGTSLLIVHFSRQLTRNDLEDYNGPSKFCPINLYGEKNYAYLLARRIWKVQGVERIVVYRYKIYVYFGKKFAPRSQMKHLGTVIKNYFFDQEIWKREIENVIQNSQLQFLRRHGLRPSQ